MQTSVQNHTSITYRPEIDGLRAIAVLSVIFFHAGFSFLPRGFLGVDIFFVISGYLITSILLNDLAKQQFSLVQFYERRARRILPALTLVLIVTTVFAWFWLLPHELKRFGDSLFSTSLFHSNLYFAKESGYFAPDSQELPLLHIWSLAVEEQFYFVFPLLLFAAYKLSKKFGFALLVVGLVSSFCYFLLFAHKSDAIYYLPYTRAWELMLGVVCAIGLQHKSIPQASIKQDILPLLGLLLIYLAMAVKLKYSPFNLGFVTLQACLGTVLLIYFCRAHGLVKHILSAKWLVAIGLISYSAYLWHNPILAFSHVKFGYQDGSEVGYLLVMLSLLLAWASYKFVEQPFRNKSKFSLNQIFTWSLVSIIVIALVGFVFSKNDGFISRANMQSIKHYAEVRAQKGWGEHYCEEQNLNVKWAPVVCIVGDKSQQPTGLVWGDSFSGSLVYGLDSMLKQEKRSFLVTVNVACPPIVGFNRVDYVCDESIHQNIQTHILNDPTIKDVVWLGNFQEAINNKSMHVFNEKVTEKNVTESIVSSVNALSSQNKRVVFITPPPLMPLEIPEYYMRRKLNNLETNARISLNKHLAHNHSVHNIVKKIKNKAKIVYSESLFCDDEFCYTKGKNDNLWYVDRDHFSHEKSIEYARAIQKVISKP
jgi:peptidoglycan/LPS O-acetylase OafA/YrhL